MARGVGCFFLGVLICEANFSITEDLKKKGIIFVLTLVGCYYYIAKFNGVDVIDGQQSMQILSMLVISPMVILCIEIVV